MRALALLAAALLALLALCPSAFAEGLADELDTESLVSALPAEAAEALDGVSPLDTGDGALDAVADYALGVLGGVIADAAGNVLRVMAVAILCSAVSGAAGSGAGWVTLGGVAAVAVLCLGDVNSFAAMGRETVESISAFSKTLLPMLCTAAAVSGTGGSAAAKYAATEMFLQLLTALAEQVVFPLICAYAAAVTASCAFSDGRMEGVARLMKRCCRTLLVGLVSIFTAYLSLSGLVASSTDAVAVKAAKAAISTLLPVVGSVASGAAGAVLAGAGVIKSAVGAFGLAAVLAICTVPFLRLGAYYLLFKAAAALSSAMAGAHIGRLIDGIADVYGMILGLVGAAALFLFFGVYSIVRTVVSV